MPAARLFSLLHRLIPVTILSGKIPFRGCVFKESVKICTPKSPSFSDDFSPDFAAFYVFSYRSCAPTQNLGSLAQRQNSLQRPQTTPLPTPEGFSGLQRRWLHCSKSMFSLDL